MANLVDELDFIYFFIVKYFNDPKMEMTALRKSFLHVMLFVNIS
jgi:hypothetical protein